MSVLIILCSSFCAQPFDLLMVCLQDDKEIVQAVEQELQQRQIALQALQPNADADGDQGMNEDSPALMVCLLQPQLCKLYDALCTPCILQPVMLWYGGSLRTHHY